MHIIVQIISPNGLSYEEISQMLSENGITCFTWMKSEVEED